MTDRKTKTQATPRARKPRPSADKPMSQPKTAAKDRSKVRAGKNRSVSPAVQSAARPTRPRDHELGDWREQALVNMRALILEADPEMVEERKWKKPSNAMEGVPVWSHHGIVCTGETYKAVVKLTFAKGASLPDPARLFNSSLEGNTRRAIDLHEGEKIDSRAFKALIKAAVALNAPSAEKAKLGGKAAKPIKAGNGAQVVLLSGGNPQIAKADGDAPVQAYIAAMPGWKRDLGRQLDALIVRSVPQVRKAVKWNSPFYGIDGQGWFLSFHVLTKYVKVTFFQGLSLQPVPPGGTPKSKDSRWIDLYEDAPLDEAQMAAWVKQAAALPGWVP
jgi:hypothetical protein